MVKLAPLSEIMTTALQRIVDNNLSIQELSENSNVSEELLEILLNNKNNVTNDLSRLFEFLKINTYFKELVFKAYIITDDANQLKITRVIKPKCFMYFDRATQEYYRFSLKHKRHNTISRQHKYLIMNEMKEFTENYVKDLE